MSYYNGLSNKSNINYIFSVLSFLFFFNYSHFYGMIFISSSFIIYMIIVLTNMPERILMPTTLTYILSVVFVIYQVAITDKKQDNK